MAIRRTGGLVEEALTHSIIGAFYEVYTELGFGFLESVYILALERELIARGHKVTRECRVWVYYKGEKLTKQRIDLLVADKVILEVKSTLVLPPTTERQLYNYLHATHLHVGLILHFGPKPFVKRVFA